MIIPLPLHCAIKHLLHYNILRQCIANEPVPSQRAATGACFCIHCIFVSRAPTINQFGSILSVKTTGIVSHLSGACREMNVRLTIYPLKAFNQCQRFPWKNVFLCFKKKEAAWIIPHTFHSARSESE